MSWQKCDNAEPYPLAFPAVLVGALGALHIWLGLSVLTLALPCDAIVLLGYLLLRSWQNVRSNARISGSLVLSMDARNRFLINEVCRSDGSWQGLAPGSGQQRYSLDCGTNGATGNLLFVGETETGHSDPTQEHRYTCCRSTKMLGCVYLDMLDDYGKRLEILVFYRYHQREFYRRLLRHLALK